MLSQAQTSLGTDSATGCQPWRATACEQTRIKSVGYCVRMTGRTVPGRYQQGGNGPSQYRWNRRQRLMLKADSRAGKSFTSCLTGRYPPLRNRATVARTCDTAVAISAAVVKRPMEKRRDACARASEI